MKLSISILVSRDHSQRQRYLESLAGTVFRHIERTSDEIEVLVGESVPFSKIDRDETGKQLIANFPKSPRLSAIYASDRDGRSLGPSHNKNLVLSSGEIFILLEGQIEIQDSDWIARLVAPFENPKVALAGPKNGHRRPAADGNREIPPEWHWDVNEGPILAIRAHLAQKHGLLASDLRWETLAYADLCLRYRQVGYDISAVAIALRQVANYDLAGSLTLKSVQAHSQSRFLERWSRPHRSGRFSNRVLFDLQGGGWGDAALALPALLRILRDHPTAEVDLYLNHPFLAVIFEMERVSVHVKERLMVLADRPGYADYDRVFHLTSVDFASPLYLGALIAAAAGVDFDGTSAKAYLRQKFEGRPAPALNSVPKETRLALIHAESLRQSWEGRAAALSAFKPLVEILRKKGYAIALLGGAHPKPEYMDLIGSSDLNLCGLQDFGQLITIFCRASHFVGIDSGPLHLAQLTGTPSFAIFGATLPFSKLLDLQHSYGYARHDLDCIGCYHETAGKGSNSCLRRDQACVAQLDISDVEMHFEAFLKDGVLPVSHLIERERRIVPKRSAATLRYSGSLEDFRLRELLSVLARKLKRVVRDRADARSGSKDKSAG